MRDAQFFLYNFLYKDKKKSWSVEFNYTTCFRKILYATFAKKYTFTSIKIIIVPFSEMSDFLIIQSRYNFGRNIIVTLYERMKPTCDFVARNDKQRKQNRSQFYVRR